MKVRTKIKPLFLRVFFFAMQFLCINYRHYKLFKKSKCGLLLFLLKFFELEYRSFIKISFFWLPPNHLSILAPPVGDGKTADLIRVGRFSDVFKDTEQFHSDFQC